MFQEPARRQAAELFEKLRPEKRGRIWEAQSAALLFCLIFEPLANDQLGFFRRPAFAQQHGARFFNSVDIGLSDHAAHLAVEILQARDHHNRIGQPVGDLDEVAYGALKTLLGVIEKAQIFDLVDAEHQGRALHRPHQSAKRGNDLKGAVFARIWIERADSFVCQRRELPAMQVLADTLIDARIAALQVKQRTHDVDVHFLRLELIARDDVVGESQDEARQTQLVERVFAQDVEVFRRDNFGVQDHPVRQTR